MLIRLTVVGSINLGFSMQAERMPVSGENVRAEDLELAPAGEGALQAIAAARLGAEVTLVGCVGHDSHGQVLRRRLSHEGVNVKYLATDAEVGTGMAFEVVADHHHRVFSVLDANLRCTPEHIESTHRAFERAGFVLLSLGLPEDTVNRALQVSADCEVQVLLQPAPLSKKPPQLWNRANLLTPSRVAAARLSGKPTEDQAGLVAALEKLRARPGPRRPPAGGGGLPAGGRRGPASDPRLRRAAGGPLRRGGGLRRRPGLAPGRGGRAGGGRHFRLRRGRPHRRRQGCAGGSAHPRGRGRTPQEVPPRRHPPRQAALSRGL